MQHKYRSNKKETHDQNWNRPNFEAGRVLGVEAPHAACARGRGAAGAPGPAAGILPLPDGGAGGAGGHGFAGRAAGGAHVGGAGAGSGHDGGGAAEALSAAPPAARAAEPRPLPAARG